MSNSHIATKKPIHWTWTSTNAPNQPESSSTPTRAGTKHNKYTNGKALPKTGSAGAKMSSVANDPNHTMPPSWAHVTGNYEL
jgi:hypothetical protein